MRRKKLSDNQQEIIETYLPEELFKSKKLDDGMKLVLANIYRFYMYDKNVGKKSIFRTNRSFMRDIEVKDPNELHRPLTRLIMRGFITRKTGNSDEKIACEYTLMPQFYEMLPDCFKADSIEVSDDFENSKVTTGTDTVTDTVEDKEKIQDNTGVDMSTGTRKSDEHIHEELSLNFSSSSKTRSELESEHYDTVVVPQLRRIEQWDENPEPEGYKQISIMSGWNDFPQAADWFENDIKNKVSDEDWNQYLCINFNRVKDKYLQAG